VAVCRSEDLVGQIELVARGDLLADLEPRSVASSITDSRVMPSRWRRQTASAPCLSHEEQVLSGASET